MHETARRGARPATAVLLLGPPPTGRRERLEDRDWVVYERRLEVPVSEAWAVLTSPEHLARWVGTWRRTGDARAGEFTFAFEGDGLLPLSFRVEHLEPGRRATIALFDRGEADAWLLDVSVADAGGATALTVRQSILNPALAPAVAAGCEFYLDRLVAMLEGRDLEALDYDDYFLRLSAHYRRLFPVQRSARHG